MRKILTITLVLLITVLSFCGCRSETKNDMDAEALVSKLTTEIDGAYREEQNKPEYTTTVGMVELADKYTQKWAQIADEYYNKIMSSNEFSKDYKNDVSNMKAKWETDSQNQYSSYVKELHDTYNGGSIIGPLAANYKYEMQKKWALQLVEMYQQ